MKAFAKMAMLVPYCISIACALFATLVNHDAHSASSYIAATLVILALFYKDERDRTR